MYYVNMTNVSTIINDDSDLLTIVKAAIVISRCSSDTIILDTTLPSPVPNVTKHNLQVVFYAEKDKGEEYVKKHFPNVPYVIHPS